MTLRPRVTLRSLVARALFMQFNLFLEGKSRAHFKVWQSLSGKSGETDCCEEPLKLVERYFAAKRVEEWIH